MARTPPLRTRSGGGRKKGRKRPCWRARCSRFCNGDAPTVVQFEELADLHDVVEMWADWNEMRRSLLRSTSHPPRHDARK